MLPSLMQRRCTDKGETCLLKSVRLAQIEMTYSMLNLIATPNSMIPSSVLTITDTTYRRNILHWAILSKLTANETKDLVDLLVSKFDADRRELRDATDAKGKKAQEYD